MILHSLRSRLVLMSAVIAALVAVAAGLTFRRVTTFEVDRFASEVESRRHAPLRELLSSYYAERGSWEGVEDLLRRLEPSSARR